MLIVHRPSSMNEPTVTAIEEWESREVPLPEKVYAHLRARYARQLDVTATDRPGIYRIAARDHVGRVGLPGGGMLVIRPKVGVANLFYMLTANAGLARFQPPPAGLAPNAEIFTFILALLIEQAEMLFRQGLYRAYLSREEDLPFVRGRIVLGAQLRRHAELKHRHVCAYTDLTLDTAENRVLAATLRLLPALLRPGIGEDASMLMKRARALLPRFDGVGVISRNEALALLPTMTYHRLNAAYEQVLSLCLLALQHLTLDERPGPHPFASFLVDMPRLFESFVTTRLRAHLAAHGLRVVAQRHDYLDEARKVGIRPDVLIYPSGVGSTASPLLVLDAKYRRLEGDNPDLNRDLYQVSAYADRYKLRRGVLVYPQFREAAHTEIRLRGTTKQLYLATLNLAASNPAQLEHNCALLAVQLASLSAVP